MTASHPPPDSFLALIRRWGVVPDGKLFDYAEQSETTAEYTELIAEYIVRSYNDSGPSLRKGNLGAWLPWAYAVAHKAVLIEEMQDAAQFSEQGSNTDESVYQELRKRVDAIRTSAFLPDGYLHGRPEDSHDIPQLPMDSQEDM